MSDRWSIARRPSSVAIVAGVAVTVPERSLARRRATTTRKRSSTTTPTGCTPPTSASLESATELDAAIDAFLADPTDETLEAAKQAWLAARDDYGLTEAFRFYGGPIDNEDDGPEGLINAWPLDEAYIDYVEGDPAAGIINDPDTYPTIDAELLTSLNEQGGEANISTGWHAIEFLLWGQDLSADGPGARPVTDYTTADNADRRAHLPRRGQRPAARAPRPGSSTRGRRTPRTTAPSSSPRIPTEALTMILTGIGELTRGELAGERMNVAYEQRSQEDEHSCFSDNTTADLLANARGIDMVLTGVYPGGVEGPGLLIALRGRRRRRGRRAARGGRREPRRSRGDPGAVRPAPRRRRARRRPGPGQRAHRHRGARSPGRRPRRRRRTRWRHARDLIGSRTRLRPCRRARWLVGGSRRAARHGVADGDAPSPPLDPDLGGDTTRHSTDAHLVQLPGAEPHRATSAARSRSATASSTRTG